MGHVLGDSGLRDIDPELQQLAMNAWRAPERVIAAHCSDQIADLGRDRRSAEIRDLNSPTSDPTSSFMKSIILARLAHSCGCARSDEIFGSHRHHRAISLNDIIYAYALRAAFFEYRC